MNFWIEIRPVAEDLSRAGQTAAWQALVRERLARELGMTASGKAGEQARDIEIRYAENGAPEVFVGAGVRNDPNRELSTNRAASDLMPAGFIGVSHTRGWVAVVWHPAAPCAVDIELRSRVLPESVARRYGLSSMEDWCAREALWKYAGATGRRPELSDAGKALDPKTVRFLPHPDLIVAVITNN